MFSRWAWARDPSIAARTPAQNVRASTRDWAHPSGALSALSPAPSWSCGESNQSDHRSGTTPTPADHPAGRPAPTDHTATPGGTATSSKWDNNRAVIHDASSAHFFRKVVTTDYIHHQVCHYDDHNICTSLYCTALTLNCLKIFS